MAIGRHICDDRLRRGRENLDHHIGLKIASFLCAGVLLSSGCGPGRDNPRGDGLMADPGRTVHEPGGLVTVGFRIVTDGDDGGHSHLEAVVIDMDGHESITDLGEMEAEVVQVEPSDLELGHLRMQEGDVFHDLVLFQTDDPDRLELRWDGELMRVLELPEHDRLEIREPFLLSPGLPEL